MNIVRAGLWNASDLRPATCDYLFRTGNRPSTVLLFSTNSQQDTLHLSKFKRLKRSRHTRTISTGTRSQEQFQRPHLHFKLTFTLSTANQITLSTACQIRFRFLQNQIPFLQTHNWANKHFARTCVVYFHFGISPSATLFMYLSMQLL